MTTAPKPPTRQKRAPSRAGAATSNVTYYVVMTAFSLIYLVPLVWMVLSSFKSQQEIFGSPWSLPTSIDFSVLGRAWKEGGLGTYVINSIIVTTVSVFAILLFGAMAAFALSRLNFRLRGFFLVFLALGLLLPVQSYFIAQSSLLDRLHITDTRWALIIPYIGLGLSLAVYLLKAYLDTLPRELFESARMDGCSDIRMFFVLVFPLIKPGLATVAVFSILTAWNEFLLATLYIQSDEYKTIPVGLLTFTGKYATDYPMLFSALSIVTVPMIAIYVIFHRQVISGITEGTIR
ncbi:MAG TPA: carbohydrate ABC transporter permease [Actinomycetes bacterium]|nr:carbohydrate ABC transporter permease [Actinomycetes bacterium]